MAKSILLLAYSWPPDVSVGAVRPVYLTRQFVRLGWHTIVVTVRERYYERMNTSGVMGADSAFVIRTHCLPSPRHAYLWVKKWLAWTRRQLVSAAPNVKYNDGSTPNSQKVVKPAHGWLKGTFLSLLHTPDEFQGWFPFALVASLRIIGQHRPDCVISTAPPFTSHLVALVLKRLFGIPWVADFRDPWTWYEFHPSEIHYDVSRWINRRLEKMVMQHADRIVCVTPAMTEKYRQLYPNLPDNKWVTITNGFDLDEFAMLDPVEKSNRFTISYVGSFAFSRTPQPLLKAIGELIAEGRLDRHMVTLRFVGACQFVGGRPMTEMIAENKLDGIAEIIGVIPRTDALRESLRANVLVLLGGTQRLTVAAKIYEYIAARKPILAIVEEGATSDIIRQVGGGRVVAPDDLAGIKDAIAFWYDEYIQKGQTTEGYQSGSMASSDEFSWARLGVRYVSVLDECCINQ